jgi:hypothetical protein
LLSVVMAVVAVLRLWKANLFILWEPPTVNLALANHSQKPSAAKQRLSKHVSTGMESLDIQSVAR